MAAPLTSDELYYSALAADADLAELVAMFVEEMPGRVRAFEVQFESANRDELARLAHQLKGSAGSYGFDQLTPFAARLESVIRGGEPPESIQLALDELIDSCWRVRAGIAIEDR
jgi:HPt (histidine-containing phosphotransfer) domain-containing protein